VFLPQILLIESYETPCCLLLKTSANLKTSKNIQKPSQNISKTLFLLFIVELICLPPFLPGGKKNSGSTALAHAQTPRCLAVVVLQHLKHQRLTCEKHGVSPRNMGISWAYHGNGMEYLINLKGARGSPTLTYIYIYIMVICSQCLL